MSKPEMFLNNLTTDFMFVQHLGLSGGRVGTRFYCGIPFSFFMDFSQLTLLELLDLVTHIIGLIHQRLTGTVPEPQPLTARVVTEPLQTSQCPIYCIHCDSWSLTYGPPNPAPVEQRTFNYQEP